MYQEWMEEYNKIVFSKEKWINISKKRRRVKIYERNKIKFKR